MFTDTSGVVKVISGLTLIRLAGYHWFEPWLVVRYGLYIVAFAARAPVVWIQIRVRDLAAAAVRAGADTIPSPYPIMMRWWFALGWPAFLGLLGIFWLMIAKPTLW